MPDETSRVLTLVFTDLADSTALKMARGDAAVDELITRHREHVTRLAAECAGRVIDWAGDGCFLTLETSSAGVMFALRLQQVHSDESDLPGVRIGIHLGEVTEKPGPGGTVQIKGLAVDVAARIQGLAKPGQVLMSSAVYNSARQRMGVEAMGLPLLWQLHGTYALKGFDTPLEIAEAGIQGLSPLEAPKAGDKARLVRKARKQPEVYKESPNRGVPIWAFAAVVVVLLSIIGFLILDRRSADNARPIRDSSASENRITSLAVLPFANLMGDPAKEYFVDGMTDTLTAELAKIDSIRVIARTSAMRYKDSELSAVEIAAELGVEGLIEGSVQQADDEIKITAQLIDGRSEEHVWAENFDGTTTGILRLQGEVALAIAEAVDAELSAELRETFAGAEDVDPEAYDLYLQGLEERSVISSERLREAVRYFERARTVDPGFADAWGMESDAYMLLAGFGFVPSSEALPKARHSAEEALKLDARNASALNAFMFLSRVVDLDQERARNIAERALALNPNDPNINRGAAYFFAAYGDRDRSIALAEHALSLDPNSFATRLAAGTVLYYNYEFERAREVLEPYLVDGPDGASIARILIPVYTELRRDEDADALIERYYSDAAPGTLGDWIRALGEVRLGPLEEAAEHFDLLVADDSQFQYPMIAAIIAVHLGRLDSAFDLLERGVESWDVGTSNFIRTGAFTPRVLADLNWQRFVKDTRFWELQKRIGYPAYPESHPGHAYQQAHLARNAAEEVLAAQPKPVRRYEVVLGSEYPLSPASGFRDRILAVSPDGERLVYQSSGGKWGRQLVLRELDRLEVRPLAGTEGAERPFFSPDGGRIGFFANGMWKSFGLTDDRVETLVEAGFGAGATWDADGTVIVSGNVRQGLQRFTATGELIEELTTVDVAGRDAVHALPQAFPQGASILYTVSETPGIDSTRVEALRYESDEPVVIAEAATAPSYVSSGHILYAKRGALMAVPFSVDRFEVLGPAVPIRESRIADEESIPGSYAVSRDGTLWYTTAGGDSGLRDYVWIDLNGREEATGLPPSAQYPFPSLSPDGTRMVVDNGEDIYVADFDQGTSSRLTFDESVERWPIWHPDGDTIWYNAYADPGFSIRKRSMTGWGEPTDAFSGEHGTGNFVLRSWTPDRSAVVGMLLAQPGGIDLGVLTLSDSPSIRRLIAEPGSQGGPSLSHDGNWIAYHSSEGGPYEVFVRPYPSLDGKWQITKAGGSYPQWSADDSRIYFVRENSIMAVAVQTEPNFVHGREEEILTRSYLNSVIPPILAPDGQRFLVQKPAEISTGDRRLIVVENFVEELKRLAPHPEEE